MAAISKSVSIMVLLLIAIWVAESKVLTGGKDQVETQYQLNGFRNGPGSLKTYQCGGECKRRCGRTQYKKPCLFYCNKCCKKCLCVPPGYYGNKQVCPCYNNWKTKRGGPKCP